MRRLDFSGSADQGHDNRDGDNGKSVPMEVKRPVPVEHPTEQAADHTKNGAEHRTENSSDDSKDSSDNTHNQREGDNYEDDQQDSCRCTARLHRCAL
jgi:hypothetical protein